MAIVEMSKMRLLGLKSEQLRIMDVLTRSHVFEPKPSEQIEGTVRAFDEEHLEKVLARQARLAFAVELLTSVNAEAARRLKAAKKAKRPAPFDYVPVKTGGRKIVTYADFYDCAAKEYELMAVCDRLEKLSFRRTELTSEKGKLDSKIKLLLPYSAVPVKLSDAGETRTCAIMIAAAQSASAALDGIADRFTISAEEFASPAGKAAVVVCLKSDAQDVRSALGEEGYALCPFTDECTAGELLCECNERMSACDGELERIFADLISYEKYLTELKTLYDVLGTDAAKSAAEREFAKTGSTFVAEGWVPAGSAETVADAVKAETENVIIWITAPEESDDPPILLDNPKVIKPFESITNMYSPPSYREKDPNITMAIFFFIIFGMMMADAGYGLILSLACTFVVYRTKMEKGVKDLAAVFGICGISTVIWGALFGSWFGLSLLPPLWFNPLEQPIMLLAACLILGIIHLLTGYGYQAYYLIKKKKPFDALCDVGFIYLLFVGIAMLALPMVVDLPAVISSVGLYTVLASLVLIFLTGGRHSKGIFGKIGGGVSALYGLVNLFSDILSYARIFGIALAGGAIASAFNTILGVLAGSPAMIPVAVVLGIALHLFNLLISLLGAYVHNARLQFLEFYGKFYTGDGRLFSPVGEKTKYIRFV